MNTETTTRVLEVAAVFLKLGAVAFGGPAAHIAMMEREVVQRRGWVSRAEFLDLLSATNLIPGPNSTELALHLGHRRAGWLGLLMAGVAFIGPAFLIVLGLAHVYVEYGRLPEASGLLDGVKPVIIAVVVQALWGLGRAAVKTRFLVGLGVAGALLAALGVNELAVLLASGCAALLTQAAQARKEGRVSLMIAGWKPVGLAASVGLVISAVPVSLGPLFLFFLKVGSVLFGSGYVLLAFLRADLVERWGWLSEAQLLDAVAIGQITPGPVFTTATFIGYLLAGTPGAWVATVGIFLPAFVFVAISGPLVPRLRRSPSAGAFLDGVNVASLALMLVVTWQLGRSALVDWPSVALALVSLLLVLRWRVNSAWLVLGGAAVGSVVQSVGR